MNSLFKRLPINLKIVFCFEYYKSLYKHDVENIPNSPNKFFSIFVRFI